MIKTTIPDADADDNDRSSKSSLVVPASSDASIDDDAKPTRIVFPGELGTGGEDGGKNKVLSRLRDDISFSKKVCQSSSTCARR